MVAEFDQALAEIEEIITICVTTMDAAMQHYRREEVIVSMATAMTKRCESADAACQYLAVACYRLQQMQETIRKTMDIGLKDSDSPPSN